MKYSELIKQIVNLVGGPGNIDSFTNCMTRLRITVNDQNLVKTNDLRNLDGIMGVVPGKQTMIVLGVGHAQRAREALEEYLNKPGGPTIDDYDLNDVTKTTKAKVKSKQTTSIQKFFRQIGNIFMPILPGWIGCGLIGGFVNIVKNANPTLLETSAWFALLAAVAKLVNTVLNTIVGWNSSKEFGGTPILGAIAAALMYTPALNGIPAAGESPAIPLTVPFLNFEFSAGLGGILGVIFAAWVFAFIEKQIRKITPQIFELFIVPLATILIGGLISILVVQPIAGLLMDGITYLLVDVAMKKGGIIGGYFLSATFLPLVMLGIHRGLLPIHAELIEQTGHTILLPILAMAGAGQVGMAFAILAKTKNRRLKNIIANALPVGILGIGEPLIYGVSLPLGKPFITACLGGGLGGIVLSLVNNYIGDVGAIAPTTSGLVLTMLIDNSMWMYYLLGLIAAYIGGFVLTYFFGFDDSLLDRLN